MAEAAVAKLTSLTVGGGLTNAGEDIEDAEATVKAFEPGRTGGICLAGYGDLGDTKTDGWIGASVAYWTRLCRRARRNQVW